MPKGDDTSPIDCLPLGSVPPFHLEHVSEEDVALFIQDLEVSKATGCDQIPVLLIKRLQHFLTQPIRILINRSFDTSSIPAVWKRANVTPIYKNAGSKSDVRNYRPISVTSTVQDSGKGCTIATGQSS